jgi:hypothetical protein
LEDDQSCSKNCRNASKGRVSFVCWQSPTESFTGFSSGSGNNSLRCYFSYRIHMGSGGIEPEINGQICLWNLSFPWVVGRISMFWAGKLFKRSGLVHGLLARRSIRIAN